MSDKEYLGDSVYAEHGPFRGAITLTTQNGLPTDPSNEIVLEPQVLEALDLFREQLKETD